MKMDLESEATRVREAQGTPNCQRRLLGPNGAIGPIGAIAPAVAAREARSSDIVRAVTSSTGYTRSVREIVYKLKLAQFHPAEKDQAVSSRVGKVLSSAFYGPLFLKFKCLVNVRKKTWKSIQ